MAGCAGHGQIAAKGRNLSNPARLGSVSEIPFHAQLTEAFFINGDNVRRQLNLLDGNIHLQRPLLQRFQRGRVISDQQAVGTFVDRYTPLWTQKLFRGFLQFPGIRI